MSDNDKQHVEQERLRALPVQLIEMEDGVLVVRGCTEFKVIGDRAAEAVKFVLSLVDGDGATRTEICAHFAETDREAADLLINQFVAKQILVPFSSGFQPLDTDESSLDMFYWHFGAPSEVAASRMNDGHFIVLGVNAISRQLTMALARSGVTTVNVVDYRLARNLRMFEGNRLKEDEWPARLPAPQDYRAWMQEHDPSTTKCVIATCDYGGTPVMREWNRFCMDHNINFLPILLRRMMGFVGPLVVPGKTACYECMMARENAHIEDPALRRHSELAAYHGQAVSGFHPSMASILGDLAALELTKFYSGAMLPTVGTLIEVSLLVPTLVNRRVLRAPRCPLCAPLMRRAGHSLQQADFMPGSQFVTAEQNQGDGQYSSEAKGLILDSKQKHTLLH